MYCKKIEKLKKKSDKLTLSNGWEGEYSLEQQLDLEVGGHWHRMASLDKAQVGRQLSPSSNTSGDTRGM